MEKLLQLLREFNKVQNKVYSFLITENNQIEAVYMRKGDLLDVYLLADTDSDFTVSILNAEKCLEKMIADYKQAAKVSKENARKALYGED